MADLQFSKTNGSILFAGASQQEKMLFASLFGSFYKVEFQDLPLNDKVGHFSFDLYVVCVDTLEGVELVKDCVESEIKKCVIAYGDIENLTKNEILVVGRALDQFQTPFNHKAFAKRIKDNMDFAVTKGATNFVSAERDSVTGLHNREAFIKRVSQTIAGAPAASYVITCLDIDGFKHVNERMGHSEGNRVLKAIAEIRKREVSKHGGFVCRDMSDIFFTLLPNDDTIIQEVTTDLAQELREIKTAIPLSYHIGRYVVSEKDVNVNLILDRVLFACKSIKNSATKREVWFNEKMLGSYALDQEMTEEMTSALEKGEFVVHYQPQIDYTRGVISGVEALVRWQHPKRGLIYPDTFIPLFERNGFVSKLDPFVWDAATKTFAEWNKKGYKVPSISINVSPVDFLNLDIVETLQRIVRKNEVKPHQLHLEINESAFLEKTETVIKTVATLKELGYIIEMDDFGAGSSSLNILKDVSINALKLDMSFLQGSENNEKSGIIVSTIVRMANWLQIPVIAEGVEKREHAEFLKTIGCSNMQGYHFSIPLEKDVFEEQMLKNFETSREIYRNQKEDASISFLDSSTQASLLFNSFVGGAIIAELGEDKLEVIRVNDSFFEVMNVSFEDFVSCMINFFDAVTDETLPLLKKALSKAKETKKTQTCEIETKATSALSDAWVELHCRHLASSGSKDLFCLTAEDITKRKKTEKALSRDFGLLLETIKTIPVGFARLTQTPQGFRFTYVNESLYQTLGYPSGYFTNILQYDFYPYIHTDDLENFRQQARIFTKDKDVFRADIRIMKANGHYIWMRLVGTFLKTNNPADPVTLNLTLTDISSLKNLEASQKSLISNSPGGVIILHLDQTGVNCNYVSEGFLRLTGFDAETAERVFANIEDSVHPDDIARIQEVSGKAFQTITPFSADYRIINSKKEYFWINLSGSPVRNSDGSIDFYCTYTDIDRHVRSEEKTRLENKRNKLYLEMNNLAMFDYVVETDTLSINVNWANKGYTELRHPGFLANAKKDAKVTQKGMADLRTTFESCLKEPHQGSVDIECDVWGEGNTPVRITYVCGTDDTGKLSGITGVIQDLREEQNKNRLLRIAYERNDKHDNEADITKTVFNYLVDYGANERTIRDALGMIGLFYNASRAYLIEADIDTCSLISSYEWTKQGVLSSVSKENGGSMNKEQAEAYRKIYDKDGFLLLSDTRNIPESPLSKHCFALGIKSMIQFQTKIENNRYFLFGLDHNDEGSQFNESIKEPVKLFANTFKLFLRGGQNKDESSFNKSHLELLNSVVEHYSIIDPTDFFIIHADDSFQEKFGKTEKGLPCYKQYFGLETPCVNCPVKKAMNGEKSPSCQLHFRNGKIAEVKTAKLNLGGKEVYLNALTDITDSVISAQKLKKLGNECIAAIQLSGSYVLSYNFKTGVGTFYSSSFEEKAMIIPDFEQVFLDSGYVVPGYEAEIHRFFSAIRQGQKKCHVSAKLQTPEIPPLWMNLDSMLIEDGNNDTAVLLFSSIQAIKDLEQETLQMKKMVQDIPVGVVMYDVDKVKKDIKMSFYNKEIVRFYGGSDVDFSNIKDQNGFSLISDDESAEKLKQLYLNLPNMPGKSIAIEDTEYVTPQGNKHCKVVANVYFENEQMAKIFVVVVDTTKQYEDKQVIAQRTNHLSIIENSLNGSMIISSTSLTKPLLFVSQNIQSFLGYTPSELNSMHFIGFRDIIYKDDYEKVAKEFARIERERPAHFEHELRFVRKDGTVFWAISKGTYLEDYEGKEAYLIAYIDISVLKKNEERLSVDEESYKYGFANSSNLVFSYDTLSGELTTPSVLCETYSIPRTVSNVPESTVAKGMIDDRSVESYRNLYKAIRIGKKDFETEIRARFYGEEYHWYKASFQIVKKERGLPRKAVILYTNIDHEAERKEAVKSKKESEQLLSIIASHSNKYLVVYDFRTGKLTPIDDPANHARRVLPLLNDPIDYVRKGIVVPEHADIIKNQYSKFINGEKNFTVRFKAKNDQGKLIWTEVIATTLFDDGKPTMTVASISDVTNAHELEIAFSHYQERLKGEGNDVPYYLDFNITNDTLEKISDKITFQPLIDASKKGYLACMDYIKRTFIVEEQEKSFEKNFVIKDPVLASKEKEMVFKTKTPDNKINYTIFNYQIIKDPYANDYRIVIRFKGVSKEKQKELELLNKARYDEVTKQFNRTAFVENVLESIKLSDKGRSNGAFVIFDIDNFKTINDTFGHIVGDHALAIISESAAATINGRGYIGRLGGDEFGVYISSFKDLDDLKELLKDIQAAGSYEIAKDFWSSISVGVSVLHKDAETFEDLYKKADIALYSVKKGGKNAWALFDENMDSNIEDTSTPIDHQ